LSHAEPAARDLGLAYVELATKNHDPNLIEKAWPLLRAAPQIDDPALLNALGGIMAADNRRDQAIAAYRVSLRLSPEQPDILLRLAALLEPAPEARSLRARAARLLPLP
jgi:cytochrome c-type biogenesis protein CcmH/NrfG